MTCDRIKVWLLTEKGQVGVFAIVFSLSIISCVISALLTYAFVAQDPDSAEFYIDRIDSNDLQERKVATFILALEYSGMGDVGKLSLTASERSEVADLLMSALSDPNSVVRLNAVSALRHNPKAIPYIRELKDDPDPDVKKLVQEVLAETKEYSRL